MLLKILIKNIRYTYIYFIYAYICPSVKSQTSGLTEKVLAHRGILNIPHYSDSGNKSSCVSLVVQMGPNHRTTTDCSFLNSRCYTCADLFWICHIWVHRSTLYYLPYNFGYFNFDVYKGISWIESIAHFSLFHIHCRIQIKLTSLINSDVPLPKFLLITILEINGVPVPIPILEF